MEEFIQRIRDIHPLTDKDLELLFTEGEKIEIPKRTAIIREGEVSRSLYLLQSGIIRGYWTDDSREATIWFAFAGEITFSSWGFVHGLPSRITIATSTDTIAWRYSKETFERLLLSSDALSVWGRKMLEQMLFTTDEWLVEFTRPLASKRYEALINKAPEVLLQIPLKEIAGYLGTTPQSLSRIRAGLVKKK